MSKLLNYLYCTSIRDGFSGATKFNKVDLVSQIEIGLMQNEFERFNWCNAAVEANAIELYEKVRSTRVGL